MTIEQLPGEGVIVSTPTDREIRAERVFDAPREQVFAAFTDPALIPEWWGGNTVVEEMDVRPGGTWRFSGGGASFSGRYVDVNPPQRLEQTFESAWAPGRVHTEIFTFEELGERTRFVATLRFETTEERDGLLAHGGAAGMNQSYARMDALLGRLAGR